jgi:hypothetical protein
MAVRTRHDLEFGMRKCNGREEDQSLSLEALADETVALQCSYFDHRLE